MTTRARTLRCSACGKRIRDHHPDLEVLEASTGKVLYYHAWCGGEAYDRARGIGGAWLATHRHVEASTN